MPVSSFDAACPQCKSNAPIVYRGVLAYCTACNAPRVPLTQKSTNLAGKTSIIGGALTRVAGWIILSGGTAIGLGLLGLLQAIFPAGFAGWAVGIPIIMMSVTIGALLLRGGRSLESSGVAAQRDTHAAAIFSLAEQRGVLVTAEQVGQAIGVSTAAADELLTALAKAQPDHVTLEIDESPSSSGGIFYRVSARGLSRVQSFDQKLRVAQSQQQAEPLEPAEAVQATRTRS
jgi:hypothetical protein